MPNAPGFFERWKRDEFLFNIPFWSNFEKIFNILETATGIERGSGPGASRGYGWHFGPRETDKSSNDKLYMTGPFRISALTGDVTVTNLRWMHGAQFLEQAGSLTLSDPGGTSAFVVAVFQTETKVVTIGSAYDSTMPEDSEYMRRPIFELSRASAGDSWTVVDDLRQGLIHLPFHY